MCMFIVFFFFFQAEDGIRDFHVTGVQTCALPIYAFTEPGLSVWAAEQNYYAVKKVYDFLGAGDKIGVHARRGLHAVAARDIEYTLDFLDKHSGRADKAWHNRLLYTFDFDEWLDRNHHLRIEANQLQTVQLKDKDM